MTKVPVEGMIDRPNICDTVLKKKKKMRSLAQEWGTKPLGGDVQPT